MISSGRNKVALFGGSFNPIHNDHLKIIKTVLEKKFVDEVWIIPCKNHPFNKELASSEDRVNMIKLAIKNFSNVKVNDIEIKSGGKSYTYDTVMKLKEKNPGKEFYFIIGADILSEFSKWYKFKELLNEIKFLVFGRKDYSIEKLSEMNVVELITENSGGISSTEIRKRIKEGKTLNGLVPEGVENYILKTKLYKKL